MTTTIKNLLSNLNHSAIGSVINLIKNDRDRVNEELVHAFEDMSANDLAHLFSKLGNHCPDFSNFSIFLHALTLIPRSNINFCANDLNVIISAIAENFKREDAINSGASEHNKKKANEAIHYLLDGYKNPCQIDMLYQIGENRTLSDGSLESFDTLFANHLIKDSCKHNTLKQNSHFYADIFRGHHLPQSFSIYLNTISEDYSRIEILFNTLSHSKRFTPEYAKAINTVFGKEFLKDLSYDEIHLNGNIATYLSVSSAIGEESIFNPDAILTRISSGKPPALIVSVLNS